jgi:hypothetical protein
VEEAEEAAPAAPGAAERRWVIPFNGSPVGEAVLEGGGRLRVGWCFPLPADSRYLRGVVAKNIIASLIRTGSAESLEEVASGDGGGASGEETEGKGGLSGLSGGSGRSRPQPSSRRSSISQPPSWHGSSGKEGCPGAPSTPEAGGGAFLLGKRSGLPAAGQPR